jgi:hypothetical protein
MSASEQFHQNCKTFIEQLAQVWVQANVGVIDAALSAPSDGGKQKT